MTEQDEAAALAPEERLKALPTPVVQLASALYDETVDITGADDPAFSWVALAGMAEMLDKALRQAREEATREALGRAAKLAADCWGGLSTSAEKDHAAAVAVAIRALIPPPPPSEEKR